MSRVIVLDSAPLGLLCAPVKKGGEAADCARWLAGLLTAGARVVVPEIADYEVRRELLRAGKASSIARLDALASATEYLPLSTTAMRTAADLWAAVRKAGKPTASEKAIDGDAILAAQPSPSGRRMAWSRPPTSAICLGLSRPRNGAPLPPESYRPILASTARLTASIPLWYALWTDPGWRPA